MQLALPFPHVPLTRIHGQPTNSTFRTLRKEIYANARAISSQWGGGQHGHLGLVMPNAEYQARFNAAWDLPAHPGAQPILPANPTAHQINEANRQHRALLDEHRVAEQEKNELQKMLIDAVDTTYIQELDDPDYGFAEVTIQDFLEHLEDRYGKIDHKDLENNREKLKTAWNPDKPIETLWADVNAIRQFAVAGDAEINDATTISLLLMMFDKSGLMGTACDKWRDKADANKTWANFRSHFTEENRRRVKRTTAAQAGFHGANLARLSLNNDPSPPKASNTSDESANAAKRNKSHAITTNDGVTMYYCWTHGLSTNKEHTSATCQNKAPGHCNDATVTNMQGGCNIIREARGRQQNRARHPE